MRVFYLAYAAAFELSTTRFESWGAYLAFNIFTGGTTVIIFVGLVLVSRRLEQLQLWQASCNQVANQPPVSYWPAPPVPTNPHYSYAPVSPVPASQTYSQELHGQGQGVQEMPVYHIQHEKP